MTDAKRAIAVRQDLPALRDRLDAAVAEFLDSPEYGKLYSEWYAAPPPFWSAVRAAWLAGVSVALLLLGMLVWQALSVGARERRLDENVRGQGLFGLPRAADVRTGAIIARGCGFAALALALAVLLGWTFDITALKNVLPGLVAMQPWAATAIALAGGALLAATASGPALGADSNGSDP